MPLTFVLKHMGVNILRLSQNGGHFPDDIFRCIVLHENVWISIKFSLKFIPKGPVSNIPSLVQIMDWHRRGNKPLSESMMVSLLTHICATQPQWVKILRHGDAFYQRSGWPLVHVITCHWCLQNVSHLSHVEERLSFYLYIDSNPCDVCQYTQHGHQYSFSNSVLKIWSLWWNCVVFKRRCWYSRHVVRFPVNSLNSSVWRLFPVAEFWT